MSEDSPKIVNLEASLELSEFFSEMDFPSETNLPLNGARRLRRSIGPSRKSRSSTWTGERVDDAPSMQEVREKLPRLSLHLEQPVHTSPPHVEQAEQPLPADTPLMEEPVESSADLEQEPVRASSHAGPATITEFPVRPQTPPAVALPSLPLGPVSLVELIERHNGFDWREAVAVIRQICLYLRDHSPQAPILLDARTIQITDKGEVRLLSGQTSSDPLVIQVGRLLRTMLMGKEAPPELRLLLSQATFELPIFESIEDVDRALAQLDKLDEPGPAGMALLRAVAAPTPLPSPEDQRGNPAANSANPPHEARNGAADAFEVALRDAPGWLRITRRRDLRGNRSDWPAARDAPRDAVPRRGASPGEESRGPDRDRNER